MYQVNNNNMILDGSGGEFSPVICKTEKDFLNFQTGDEIYAKFKGEFYVKYRPLDDSGEYSDDWVCGTIDEANDYLKTIEEKE